MSMLAGLLRDWFRIARSRRARPFVLITLFVDGAFIFIFLVAIQSYLPEQYGGGVALPGYTLAAYGGAKLAAQMFAGRLIDRLGSVRAAQLGVAVVALGQGTLLAAVWAPVTVLPAAAVYGLGAAVLWPALYARASNVFEHGERAKLTSAMTVTTVLALVGGLGVGLVLPSRFPYWAAIALAFGAAALAALAAAALPHAREEAERAEHELAAGSIRAVISAALEPRRVGFALVMLAEATALGALQAIFRSYGRDWLHVSFREELLYLAPAGAFGAVAVVVGGALADRVGRLALLGSGFIVAGTVVWVLAQTTSAATVVPLAALGVFSAGLALPSVGALSMDLSRTAGQGTVLAWFMTMEGLGHASGAALGGWLNQSVDPSAVLRLIGALFLAVGIGSALASLWSRLASAQALRLLEKTAGC